MYVHHLIALIKKLNRLNHHVHILATAHQDICFWADCFQQFNGTAYFIDNKTVPLQILSMGVCIEVPAAMLVIISTQHRKQTSH